MRILNATAALVISAAILICVSHALRAQERSAEAETETIAGVPPAALLTQRGRELADSLQMLRRTQANLGAKHPNMEAVKRQIAEIELQLKAWAPQANPFEGQAPKMNDHDLRQLVISLTQKVEQLEKRVTELEKHHPRSR